MHEFPPIPYDNHYSLLPKRHPLRREPVRRNEVGIALSRDRYCWILMTMPVGTYRRVKTKGHYVGEPALWRPLIDELKAEADAEFEREKAWRQEESLWQLAALAGPAKPREPPEPVLPEWNTREYICE